MCVQKGGFEWKALSDLRDQKSAIYSECKSIYHLPQHWTFWKQFMHHQKKNETSSKRRKKV